MDLITKFSVATYYGILYNKYKIPTQPFEDESINLYYTHNKNDFHYQTHILLDH